MANLESLKSDLRAKYPTAKKFQVISLGMILFTGSLLPVIEKANELAWQDVVVEVVGLPV
jgi:hypothetical protein